MPSYFYHLKFELYPTPDPTGIAAPAAMNKGNVWQPPSGTSVFDVLPSHTPPDRPTTRILPRFNSHQHGHRAPPKAAAWEESTQRDSNPSVIDCGALRAPARDGGRSNKVISERQWRERTESFPPPPPSAAIRPETAVRDWRFGHVSIESVKGAVRADDMSGDMSRVGPSAAPLLGPSFGGAGTATKAVCLPLDTKYTDLGWGVVHFYREGEETPPLSASERPDEESGQQEETSSTDGCTTLCIPAVPAYMSPGDFMGFVGERWTGDISHCRMVMTSRMNRYLVLLKFRDSERAKQWKREFDGRVFNSMEV
ncbi:RING finger protein ETP1, partial [Tolypocladium capitatum]